MSAMVFLNVLVNLRIKITVILILALFLSACGQTPSKTSSIKQLNGFTLTKPINLQDSRAVKSSLMSQYSKWRGTPYKYGGTSKSGIDCSAFVQNTFRNKLGYKIPRTTRTQIKVGTKVAKGNLKAGDIVFFKTGRNSLHNGIYLGNSKFVHASSSKGVTISSLENRYWQKTYLTSKRIR